MTFPASFLSIIAFALRASRACEGDTLPPLQTPLTPAAAQAGFSEALSGKMAGFPFFGYGAIYTESLTLPLATHPNPQPSAP